MNPDSPKLAVSIITPCRNEAGHIAAVLDSLLTQDSSGLDLEFLIADGMSSDGTRAILQSVQARDARVRIIDNPRQIVSTGMNAAIRAARGEIIVRMDAHTEYAPDYVRRCVDVLLESGADNVGGAPRVSGRNLRLKALAAAYHSPFAVGGALSHDPDYEGYVDSVFYGCWRKETLERFGLFDETLVRNQDDELNLRITRAGGRIWQSRKIVCWYQPRVKLAGLWQQYLQYGFWKVAVIRKHRIPASWRHLVPGAFLFAVLALPLGGLFAGAVGSRALASAFWGAWLAIIAAYAAASVAAALLAARKVSWKVIPMLPLLFATYHFAYGSGFLWGLAFWSAKGRKRTPGALLTRLSR